jgi:hypothetical protein
MAENVLGDEFEDLGPKLLNAGEEFDDAVLGFVDDPSSHKVSACLARNGCSSSSGARCTRLVLCGLSFFMLFLIVLSKPN